MYIEPLSTKLYMDMHIESIMYCTNFVVYDAVNQVNYIKNPLAIQGNTMLAF